MGMAELGQRLTARVELPQLMGSFPQETLDRLPEWSVLGLVGTLQNVYAGRIANRFDLGGTNQMVDAACASSLASVAQACQELLYGDTDFALAGGVDIRQTPFDYMSLSKTQALSPTGNSLPFDKKADGIVLGEGIGLVALKRYEDAIKDDDRIYAKIKAWGSSSDGRAKSLFNPSPDGQKRALKRAYKRAGFPISTVDLLCAHGTGTVAGDTAEVETIIGALKDAGAEPDSVALHSIKAQIGHTKGSAGIASLIEACLAMHHRVIPPQMGVDDPQDMILDDTSPVYLNQQAKPWLRNPDHPRRAGVSAFGFGGTNFHLVLEEALDEDHNTEKDDPVWSSELLLFKGENRQELIDQANSLISDLENGAEPRLCDLAYSTILRSHEQKESPATMVIVAKDLKHLKQSLTRALPHLKKEATWPLDNNIRIIDSLEAKGQQVSFMFPGQGSQHTWQGAEMTSIFPELWNACNEADRITKGKYPKALSEFLYPPSLFVEDEEKIQNDLFKLSWYSSVALAYFQSGMIDLIRTLDLQALSVVGHSLGEPASFHYAGHISREDWIAYVEKRMKFMHGFAVTSDTQLLAVGLDQAEALELAIQYPTLNLANYNATNQTVIGGSFEDIDAFRKNPDHGDLQTFKIQLTGAFHCTQFHVLRPELIAMTQDLDISPKSNIPVYNAHRAKPEPQKVEKIRNRFACNLTVPIDWVETIRRMYDDGTRVFVELGPRSVLANLCDNILTARSPFWAVSLDGEGGGLRGFLIAIGQLIGWGVDFNPLSIYERRLVKKLDLDNLLETTKPKPLSPTTWFVNGGHARPMADEVGHLGKQPLLTVETKRALETAPSLNGNSTKTALQLSETNPNEPPPVPVFPPNGNPQLIMAEYQRRMQLYLEHQDAAMRAYMAAYYQQPQQPGQYYPNT
ncbi:phthiocerol/phenolphthiocerol synthesis polyketide synthase type I PpsA [bacterium BMS3Bbin04]|nr:phthiocerol/phenolphthiocerol synthesis polyketide synthase type I PpsA [bacterium BMS3Bbin04]